MTRWLLRQPSLFRLSDAPLGLLSRIRRDSFRLPKAQPLQGTFFNEGVLIGCKWVCHSKSARRPLDDGHS